MIVTIYFAQHPVFITNNLEEATQQVDVDPHCLLLHELTEETLALCRQLTQTPGAGSCIFYHPDIEELTNHLFKDAIHITAGGGLVFNEANELLLIYRRNKWDLPKGKLDLGETVEACALREVSEETGLTDLSIRKQFFSSLYCYSENDQLVLKRVEWFVMRAAGQQALTPQVAEEITDIRWVSLAAIQPYMENTYETIKELVQLAQRGPDRIG